MHAGATAAGVLHITGAAGQQQHTAGSSALDCVRCFSVRCFIKTMQLLAKLLSVSRRARLCGQPEHVQKPPKCMKKLMA
jgi:hypothetical protein